MSSFSQDTALGIQCLHQVRFMFENRLVINIFSNWSNFLILVGVRFFLTPFLIHKLGDNEYGIWILIISLVGYMELLKLGTATGIIKYISQFIQIKDHRRTNEIFNTGFILFLSLAFVILLSVLILAFYLPTLFNFDQNYLYKIIFIIVGIDLAFEVIFLPFSAALRGQQKFFEINIIVTSIFLIRTLSVVLFLMAGYKLLALALIQICTSVLRGIVLSFYLFKTSPKLRLDFTLINKNSFKLIFHYTLYNFLVNISAKVNLTGSILIIGHFLSASAVTFYSIANILTRYLHTFIIEMQRVLIPRFSELEAQDNTEKIRDNFHAFTRLTLIIATPITFIFICYGNSFLTLWVGSKYADLSSKILAILAVGKFFYISQLTIETTLKGIGKHKHLSYLKILESIAVLTLSILLVKKYNLIGVAYGNTIPNILFNLIVIPIYACNLLKIPLLRYYFDYFIKNTLAICLLLLIYYNIEYPIDSYLDFGLLSLLIIIAFFALSFVLVLNLKERQLVYPLFRIKR